MTARRERGSRPRWRAVRAAAARVALRHRRTDGQRGAVIVEFALVLPLLVSLTFGIVEFSSAYHASSTLSDATRAGGRVGSALATEPTYAQRVADAVAAALQTLPADEPQELWIYKANANGYPGTGNDFSTCAARCIRYLWQPATKSFDTASPQGGGWAAGTHQVCNQPFDEIGVYVKMRHAFVTRLFGTTVTLDDHAVFRFEPVPSSVCAP